MSAILNIQAKYVPCYEDPRTTPGFPADTYPAGQDDETTVPEIVQEAKARFKAVYARRNACLRTLSGLQPGDPNRPPLLEQVSFLTEAIDHLEDVYAPIGFVAEPVMDDAMFTSELAFTHARLASARGEPCESSFSLYIPIPLEDPKEMEGPDAS
jgi:hypothetical protein